MKPSLERYNQLIWAAVGTGVLAAAVVGLIAAAAFLIYSAVKDDAGGVKVDVVDDAGTAGVKPQSARYDFCQPIIVYASPYRLIHVVSDRLVVRNIATRLKQTSRSYSAEADSYNACGLYGSKEPAAVVNVLVRHAETGEMRLALKQNAVVRALEYPQPEHQRPPIGNAFPPKGVLYWEVAADDSNRDGVIDHEDDVGAFLSDVDGRNLARITPTPSRVLEKIYDKERNLLLLRVLTDSNGDGSLGDDDMPALIESSVAQRKLLRAVLDNKTLTGLMAAAEPRRQPKHEQ